MKKIIIVLSFCILLQPLLFATGGSDAVSSSERGSYLARLGRLIPPNEIYVEAYIAQSDYNYPLPAAGALSVIPAAGYRDDTAYLMVGLMGRKEDFAALPPMNICFVIDISGSMSAQNKLDWVKESFHIFIEQVRPEDFVSVVIFDNQIELLIAPGQIKSREDRDQFRKQVDALGPRGNTNIYGGMEMGYQQVEANYRPEYTNRVILLTDGMDNASGKTKKEFLDFCTFYRDRNINISTIALGEQADINLMVDMAIAGGGSSRFISDRTVMEQTFGSELDRLVVTAVKNLSMELVLSDGVTLKETWGYSYWTNANTVHYSLDTLHNGDYETIMAEAVLTRPMVPGTVLANFYLSYEDSRGIAQREGPFPLTLGPDSGSLITDPRVREAEGYIALAKGLIDIGNRYIEINGLQTDFNIQRDEQFRNAGAHTREAQHDIPDTSEIAALRKTIIGKLDECLGIIHFLNNRLTEINESLGGGIYAKEPGILENYDNIFTTSMEFYTGESQS